MPRLRAPGPVAAVTCVLAVTLVGCGDDAPEEPQRAASSPTAEASPSSPTRGPKASPSQDAGATLTLTIAGAEVSPMAETITMKTGDVLTVRVEADRAGELHVHASPEQYVEFGPGRSRHEVTLDKPGQVDVEEHESGALVARLLVS